MKRLVLTCCLLLGLALAALLLAPTQPARAATLTVTATDDVVDGTCDLAHCSLREAITYAASGDSITLDGLADDAFITLSSEIVIAKNLSISADPAKNIHVSGNSVTRHFTINSSHTVSLSGFTLRNGNASGLQGGSIYNDGTLNLEDMTLRNNQATWGGGAIKSLNMLRINRSTLNDNSSSGGFGGALLIAGGNFEVRNSVLYNNSNNDAGAIGTDGGNLGLIENTTFSHNSAIHMSALEAYGSGTIITLTHVTVSVGSDINAAGVRARENGQIRLRNSLLANPGAQSLCTADTGGSVTLLNTLIQDGSCSATLSGDPLLATLVNNGGLTDTHALQPGSPAIDAADDTACVEMIGQDQRGSPRFSNFYGSKCDVGAFEYENEETDFVGDGDTAYFFDSSYGPFVTITDEAGGTTTPGNITVRRVSLAPGPTYEDGETNFYLEITADNNSFDGVTLTICYADAEIEKVELESMLRSFRWNGSAWVQIGGNAPDEFFNCQTTENVTDFSFWTLAEDPGAPNSVRLQDLRAAPGSFWGRLWQWFGGWLGR